MTKEQLEEIVRKHAAKNQAPSADYEWFPVEKSYIIYVYDRNTNEWDKEPDTSMNNRSIKHDWVHVDDIEKLSKKLDRHESEMVDLYLWNHAHCSMFDDDKRKLTRVCHYFNKKTGEFEVEIVNGNEQLEWNTLKTNFNEK